MILAIFFAGLVILMGIGTVRAFRGGGEIITPGVRPPLATLLCLWEFAASVFMVVIPYLYARLHTVRLGLPARPVDPFSHAMVVLDAILSVVAAIALWRMRRVAFHLFATKLGLSIVWTAVGYTRLPPAAMTAPPWMRITSYLAQLLFFAFSATVVWYVHDITKGQKRVTGTAS